MRFLLLLISAINLCQSNGSPLKFTIDSLYNGVALKEADKVSITLDDNNGSRDVVLDTIAPFYDDPAPEVSSNKPIYGLWKLEVIELFFLNDNDQYLQIQLGPHGHYLAMLLDGERNYVRHSLPLTVRTTISDGSWVARTVIPAAYLPTQVTRFNAYHMHGEGDARVFTALYPGDQTLKEPNNHNLELFGAINLGSLSPQHKTAPASLLWQTAVAGIIPFVFDRDWKNDVSGLSPTVVTLQGFKGGVEMNYTVPKNAPTLQYKKLVIIFENNDNKSLKIVLNADETYQVSLLLNREANLAGRLLTLDSIAEDQETSFTGSILIPPSYFPDNVQQLNVYSVFGEGTDETEIVLQPITEGAAGWRLKKTDIEGDSHFIPIDIDFLIEDNSVESDLWKERIANGVTKIMTTTPITAETFKAAVRDSATTTSKPSKLSKPTRATRRPAIVTTEKATPAPTKAPVIRIPAKKATSAPWNPFRRKFKKRPPTRPILFRPFRGQTPNRFGSNSPMHFLQPYRGNFNHRSLDEQLKTSINVLDRVLDESKTTKEDKKSSRFDEDINDEKLSISISDFLLENIPESVIPLLSLTIESDATTEPSLVETLPPFDDVLTTTESFIKSDLPDTLLAKDELSQVQTVPSVLVFSEDPAYDDYYEDVLTPGPFEVSETPQIDEKPQIFQDIVIPGEFVDSGFNQFPGLPFGLTYDGFEGPESKPLPPWGGLNPSRPSTPPPHPVCHTTGLIANPARCQVFHECVIEDGKWVMYNWRCMRGRKYDPDQISCIAGIC